MTIEHIDQGTVVQYRSGIKTYSLECRTEEDALHIAANINRDYIYGKPGLWGSKRVATVDKNYVRVEAYWAKRRGEGGDR